MFLPWIPHYLSPSSHIVDSTHVIVLNWRQIWKEFFERYTVWTIFWLGVLQSRITPNLGKYRVSHSKEYKVILLWWGYRFWFLLIFWILRVHEIGAFMPKSSVFIFLMLRALYGSISQHLLFLNAEWIIKNTLFYWFLAPFLLEAVEGVQHRKK